MVAYKRNPMRSERIGCPFQICNDRRVKSGYYIGDTAVRKNTDDSANKRLSIPEGFLAIDGILNLCLNVVDGLVVYPKSNRKRSMSSCHLR